MALGVSSTTSLCRDACFSITVEHKFGGRHFSPPRRIQSCGGDLERYKALAAEKTAKQESRDRLVAGAALKKVAWKMRVSEPEDCENSVIKAKNSTDSPYR